MSLKEYFEGRGKLCPTARRRAALVVEPRKGEATKLDDEHERMRMQAVTRTGGHAPKVAAPPSVPSAYRPTSAAVS